MGWKTLVACVLLAWLAPNSPQSRADILDQFNEGNLAFRQGRYEYARTKFQELAEEDLRPAQSRLASMMERGEGGPTDLIMAFVLYRRIATEPLGWSHVTQQTRNKTNDDVIEAAKAGVERLSTQFSVTELATAEAQFLTWKPPRNTYTPGPFR